MKSYCYDLEEFPDLSKEIGDIPASFQLDCTLYDYSGPGFSTKYLPSDSVDKFGSNIISVMSDFGLINLIGLMLIFMFIRSGK